MGLFFKRNKKDKDFSDIDKLFSDFEKYFKGNIQKDNKDEKNYKDPRDIDLRFGLYYIDFKNGKRIQLNLDIFQFYRLISGILSEPFVEEAWNNIKEVFRNDMDEQELFRIFRFFIFISFVSIFLEHVSWKMSLPYLIDNGTWAYDNYRSKYFNGGLGKEQFIELTKKMWDYLYKKDFFEKFKKYIEQKDEESE
jgi:hypothetical protein